MIFYPFTIVLVAFNAFVEWVSSVIGFRECGQGAYSGGVVRERIQGGGFSESVHFWLGALVQLIRQSIGTHLQLLT